MSMARLSICIATRRRQESLRKLLRSIAGSVLPINKYQFEVVVVENDQQENAEYIIKEFNSYSSIPIHYYLEKREGICFARNRLVQESKGSDFCFFVDDDQVLEKNCLNELIVCQEEYDSDGVYGKNPPLFAISVHPFIEAFHTPPFHAYGTMLNAAPTNCLLLKKNVLGNEEEPFNLKLNHLGGEDILLTSLIVKQGGIIVSNPKAIAYEIIPQNKATIKYVLRRSYRNGNAFANVELLKCGKWSRKTELILRFTTRLLWGILICFYNFFSSKKHRFDGLVRISFNAGGICALLGIRLAFYR